MEHVSRNSNSKVFYKKKVFREISQNQQGNICDEDSFNNVHLLIKYTCNSTKKTMVGVLQWILRIIRTSDLARDCMLYHIIYLIYCSIQIISSALLSCYAY